MADENKIKNFEMDLSSVEIDDSTKTKKYTPKIKVPNRFAIYASANFVNSVLKKLKEVKLALLLTSRIKDSHKRYIKSKLSEIDNIIDEQIED